MKQITHFLTTLLLLALLVACMPAPVETGQQAAEPAADTAASAAKATTATQIDPAVFNVEPSVSVVAEDSETRTVRHPLGETTLPAAPERSVVFDENLADSLLALGIAPVGSVTYYGLEGFSKHIAPMMDEVANIGQSGSPNLEQVVLLQPDLILSSTSRAEEIYEQLSEIAPTVTVNDQFSYPLLRSIARTMGVEEEGEARIATYEAKATAAREALADATAGKSVALLRVFGAELRVEGGIGYTGPVLWEALGLTPHSAVKLDTWNTTISLEQIPELTADILFLMPEIDGAELAQNLQENPLWQGLPAVQNGEVYLLEDYSHWLTFGILANEKAIDDVLNQLTP
ncbi:MAG: iron-siderophore ABC transporter substrate-binding protein [Chloroflexales bacterium]|nr:iron-siderophore ABC transporter substrate-binding protein [Chloroflexales bacterium]